MHIQTQMITYPPGGDKYSNHDYIVDIMNKFLGIIFVCQFLSS